MKPVFKSCRTFYNYLLSGKKVRCGKLVYKYTNGVLLVYDSPDSSWLKSGFSLPWLVHSWYPSSNLEKVKNNNHLSQLIIDKKIW